VRTRTSPWLAQALIYGRVYERMKQSGSRMELISVRDLSKPKAIEALKVLRRKSSFGRPEDEELFGQVYDLVGGRLAFLTKVAKSKDMIGKCHAICESEKMWFLVRLYTPPRQRRHSY
jgi:hypothetical protein